MDVNFLDITGLRKFIELLKPEIPDYPVFTGATTSADGAEGLVPTPSSGDNEKFLQGDGKWIDVAVDGVNITASESQPSDQKNGDIWLEVGGVVDPVLANNSPLTIRRVVRQGEAENYWSVGDMIPITLNGTVDTYTFNNETWYAFIIGFDHNADLETDGKHSITFQLGKASDGTDIAFVDSNYSISQLTNGFIMEQYQSTSIGWGSCYARNTICSQFLNVLPSNWQNIIATVTKYTSNGYEDTESDVIATRDKLFYLSERELYGDKWVVANRYERDLQQQYEYYQRDAQDYHNKYQHSSLNTLADYWERSKCSSNDFMFHLSDWGEDDGVSSKSLGIAPCFVIA